MPKKLTYEHVKSYIEFFKGYRLLSKEYKNSRTKLKIQCPKGHIYGVSFDNFRNGCRCPKCYVENKGESKKLTYDYVRLFIEESEYEMLSKKYTKSREKIELKCPEGHVFGMSFDNFQQGHRCPECSGTRRKTNQEIIESLQKYENIRENKNEEIEVTCKYCGYGYVPKRSDILSRLLYINEIRIGEYNFYCSQQCKDNCPIYYQILYPKGYKPATSREVQPELRQFVFERDNYTCQKCDLHKDKLEVGLHCHHKYPLNENPVESADVDACITLCEDCHKWIHQNVAGCGYGEMRC